MKRFGDWAVFFATLMAAASVGISALADPVASAASAAPAPAIAVAAPAPAAMAAPASNAAQQAPQSGYLGSEACVVCHENYDRTIEATKHGFKANARTPAAQQGCESCHGPGEAHASDPENVKPIQLAKVSASEANAQCSDLPQPRRARALGRQPAREPQRQVQRLPQRPLERGPGR